MFSFLLAKSLGLSFFLAKIPIPPPLRPFLSFPTHIQSEPNNSASITSLLLLSQDSTTPHTCNWLLFVTTSKICRLFHSSARCIFIDPTWNLWAVLGSIFGSILSSSIAFATDSLGGLGAPTSRLGDAALDMDKAEYRDRRIDHHGCNLLLPSSTSASLCNSNHAAQILHCL